MAYSQRGCLAVPQTGVRWVRAPFIVIAAIPAAAGKQKEKMKTKWTGKFDSLKTLALLASGSLATQLATGQCVPPPAGLIYYARFRLLCVFWGIVGNSK